VTAACHHVPGTLSTGLLGPSCDADGLSGAAIKVYAARARTGYRRELIASGIFELPLNLKRSRVSYAHTQAHIDALLEAPGDIVLSVVRERGRSRLVDRAAEEASPAHLRASQPTRRPDGHH
jgi:hypothetical protein